MGLFKRRGRNMRKSSRELWGLGCQAGDGLRRLRRGSEENLLDLGGKGIRQLSALSFVCHPMPPRTPSAPAIKLEIVRCLVEEVSGCIGFTKHQGSFASAVFTWIGLTPLQQGSEESETRPERFAEPAPVGHNRPSCTLAGCK